MAVPDGKYRVTLTAGDANYFDSNYRFNLEGALALSGKPTGPSRWITATKTVTVTDGRLTISNASGSVNNKLAFVKVEAV